MFMVITIIPAAFPVPGTPTSKKEIAIRVVDHVVEKETEIRCHQDFTKGPHQLGFLDRIHTLQISAWLGPFGRRSVDSATLFAK